MTDPLRIVIVDDERLVRTGFRMILEAEDDMRVVGEGATGKEAIDVAMQTNPDVMLMDVRMPEMDGLVATRRLLSRPQITTRVVMLTTFDLDEYVGDALRAGASGFLLKDTPADDLVRAVRIVAAGDALLAPSVTRRLLERLGNGLPGTATHPTPGLSELTQREHGILLLLARGMSNTEIAKELVVSEATVKTHVSNVLSKLNLRDRVQAVVLAYESGLVRPGEGDV